MTAASYEALVESASQLAETDALADLDDYSISDVATLVERNRQVLDSARYVLGPQCRVPIRFDHSFFPSHSDDLSHLGNLARAFRAEAILAASQEDFAEAASVGVDILELANAARRGGLIVDLLVGNAISGIGVELLRRMRARLDSTTRHHLVETLQRLENERESIVDIKARDLEFEGVVGSEERPLDAGFQEVIDSDDCGLSYEEQELILQHLQEYDRLPEAEKQQQLDDSDLQSLAMTRLLAVDVALRAWQARDSELPRNLAALVPRYLSHVPADPFTGDELIYRERADGTFVLYSTGPKRVDFGGKFGPLSRVVAGCADLSLDVEDFSEC